MGSGERERHKARESVSLLQQRMRKGREEERLILILFEEETIIHKYIYRDHRKAVGLGLGYYVSDDGALYLYMDGWKDLMGK